MSFEPTRPTSPPLFAAPLGASEWPPSPLATTGADADNNFGESGSHSPPTSQRSSNDLFSPESRNPTRRSGPAEGLSPLRFALSPRVATSRAPIDFSRAFEVTLTCGTVIRIQPTQTTQEAFQLLIEEHQNVSDSLQQVTSQLATAVLDLAQLTTENAALRARLGDQPTRVTPLPALPAPTSLQEQSEERRFEELQGETAETQTEGIGLATAQTQTDNSKKLSTSRKALYLTVILTSQAVAGALGALAVNGVTPSELLSRVMGSFTTTNNCSLYNRTFGNGCK